MGGAQCRPLPPPSNAWKPSGPISLSNLSATQKSTIGSRKSLFAFQKTQFFDTSCGQPHVLLGGEIGVRQSEPIWQSLLRAVHPQDLSSAREKLFLFLSGWLGGPDLYVQKFGHPRLRARHASFPVDDVARDQWMACMLRAMDEQQIEPELYEHLQGALQRTADFLRNC
ncbi:MAG: group II truncated hemoglobin [Acidithiobacillus sp.]